MFLLDRDILIKQLLPPHWRVTYREIYLKVLLTPVFSIYKKLLGYREEMVLKINMSAQVFVLDQSVKRIVDSATAYVTDNNDFSFTIFLPPSTTAKKRQTVQIFINTYLPSGMSYTLEDITT